MVALREAVPASTVLEVHDFFDVGLMRMLHAEAVEVDAIIALLRDGDDRGSSITSYYEDRDTAILALASQQSEDLIVERLFVSTHVYTRFVLGVTKLDALTRSASSWANLGGIVVHVTAATRVLEERLQRRYGRYRTSLPAHIHGAGRLEEKKQLYVAAANAASMHGCQVITVDTSSVRHRQDGADALANAISLPAWWIG